MSEATVGSQKAVESARPSTREGLFAAFRYVLPWYAAILGIPAAVWGTWQFYQRAEPNVRDAVNSSLSIVFGAVVGAVTIYVGQAIYERRKRRVELVGRLPALAYEATAALAEYYAALPSPKNEKGRRVLSPELAKIFRLDGQVAQFEIEWRSVFSGRLSRVAVNKLRRRILFTKDYLLSASANQASASEAIDWILEQAERAAQFGAREAGVSPEDPGGMMFVRFGRVTEQDKRDLSFADGPPPWEDD